MSLAALPSTPLGCRNQWGYFTEDKHQVSPGQLTLAPRLFRAVFSYVTTLLPGPPLCSSRRVRFQEESVAALTPNLQAHFDCCSACIRYNRRLAVLLVGTFLSFGRTKSYSTSCDFQEQVTTGGAAYLTEAERTDLTIS